ncbi:FAD dependent oxidoreductase [Penicillium atrosanguineum]|uniref:FAD dependent oxidoreductase n=1 Tax=Penicillium atrosanguineum TaxID=1132637 RepID=A0A9W9PRG5_9EURO|nr:FAD dependent oxidoreductase [Penicillium atrosanguineum]
MKPSLPYDSSTLSIWHRTTRSFPHLHANHFADVPASAKYLIIGSGISGVLTTWKLVESGIEGDEILIIEAREAVSGASGRNAGHIRPDAFRGFSGYASYHGPEQARKILENEKRVMEDIQDFVKTHNIDCDFNLTTTFEVCFSDKFAKEAADAFEAYKRAGGDVDPVRFYEGEEAKARTKVPGALCAYEWTAASNHPGKLVQWILNDAIKKGVKLWTHCPVTKVVKHQSSEDQFRWDIHTPRGVVAAETVIHCTNAYAAYLIPELSQFITANRAQSHAFIPRYSLSGEYRLKSTMALRYDVGSFFSVNPLLNGTIIFGGTGIRSLSENPEAPSGFMNTFDDTSYSNLIAGTATREFNSLSREAAEVPLRHGEGLDHAWTGIIGMTPDSVPLVGPLEALEGQWICAAFNGHGKFPCTFVLVIAGLIFIFFTGMAGIFRCAPGLVKLILGQTWQDTGLPECFQISKERIDRFKEPIKSSL